jgi:PAS domain S-box-containing protein
VTGLIASANDVTEAVTARKELERSQAQLNLVLENAKFGTWAVDLKNKKVTSSPKTSQIFGAPVIGTVFDTIQLVMHPQDRDEVNRRWQEAAASGEPYAHEYRIVRPGGEVRWILSKGITSYDSAGEPAVFSGILEDVTELREKEAQLERSERILRSAVEIARIGYFEWDLENNKMTFSARMQQDWGFQKNPSPVEAIDSVDDADRANVLELSQRSRNAKSPFETEYRVNRPDGRQIWIKAHGEYFYNSAGKAVLMVGTSVDITAEKLAQRHLQTAKEAAENASLAKSAFLANMSHEIRTPLGAMMGFAELLKEAPPQERERENYLDIILRNGHSLARVIDDVLDLSKVEAGRLQIELSSVSVADLIEDVVVLFSDKVRQKGIELLSFAGGPMPARVMTDPIRFRQILINIVGNAVKFTDAGVVMVATEATLDKNGEWLFEISVKDSGRGLSRSQADALFQPFLQADASTTRRYGGTGLGLVLSRRLARALGGDVVISECEIGKGCTFVISIRAREGNAPSVRPESLAPSIKGKRLLVIEDSQDNQKLIGRILSGAGAESELSLDSRQGVRLALDGNFDAVLLDIQMPEMDGYQVLAELQKQNYKKPVVAVTAHALAEERQKTEAAGFAAHVTKPIDRAELVATIARLTNRNAK